MEKYDVNELDSLLGIVNKINSGIINSDNRSQLEGYLGAINKARVLINRSIQEGKLDRQKSDSLLGLLSMGEKDAVKKLAGDKKTASTPQTVPVFDQISSMISKIIKSINETTDGDELNVLRRKTTKIGEYLMDQNIRNMLSPEEIDNIEENVSNMLRVIRKRMDLAEEVRSRRGL